MPIRNLFAITLTLLVTMPGAIAAQTSPFVRTTIVSPGATPQASGSNLLTALSSATGTSSAPWLLRIEPGIYDLGSSRLQMKSWVDLEGSSVGTTFIEGDGPSGTGDAIIKGADNSEIRSLTIRCVGTTGCRAMVNISGATNVRDVQISANLTSGGMTGIRNEGQSPNIEAVDIYLTGGTGDLRGVANVSAGGVDSRPVITGARLELSSGASTITIAGIWNEGTSTPWKMEDSVIVVNGSSATEVVGMLAVNPVALPSGYSRPRQTIINVDVGATGSASVFGIKDSYFDLEINRCRIRTWGSSGTGITSANSTVYITGSEIKGDAATVVADVANIGISRLNGGNVVANTANCGLVVDENYAHFPNQCP